MSQAGLLDVVAATPSIPTTFDTDAGTAIPVLNILEVLGGTGLNTTGAGNTITVVLDVPVLVSSGGTGLTTLTDGAIVVGNGTAAVEMIGPLTDGQLLIGDTAGASPVAATLTAGAGIGIVNAAGSITISSTSGGFSWAVVTSATQALVFENGYIGNRATAITYTLPPISVVGDSLIVTNIGAGLPVISQNAGQSIHFTASTTTVGVGGSLTAIDQFGSIELVCAVANTEWIVVDSVGSWTIV